MLSGVAGPPSFVYVIAAGPDRVKIGYSADPPRRLRQLQIGQDRRLALIHQEAVPAPRAPVLEQLIHRANAHLRVRGEWFKLSHSEAIAEVQFAVIRHGDSLDRNPPFCIKNSIYCKRGVSDFGLIG
jgi:hypothetical protein